MKKILFASGLILAAAASRLIPHPPNVTPIAAMALAGGVYLDKRFSFLIPLAALIVSDAILGFHNTIVFVYGSFLLIGFLGLWLRSHKSLLPVVGAAMASSVLFFAVTNFGVWLMGSGTWYPKTPGGLAECYIAAIPFFRNTAFGDLVYTGALFGIFELVERHVRMPADAAVPVKNAQD